MIDNEARHFFWSTCPHTDLFVLTTSFFFDDYLLISVLYSTYY